MRKRLFVASTNAGKLRDFRVASAALELAIDPLPELKKIPAPEEDGLSFAANAALKALYYSAFAPGELVLADDSGLEVDLLGGAPGVRSARFAADAGATAGLSTGPDDPFGTDDGADARNNRLLVARLAEFERTAGLERQAEPVRRTARYRAALAVARDGQIVATAEGAVEGLVRLSPRGTGGFGYDPLFELPGLGRTMAEIDLETKHGFSHRGRAMAELVVQLKALLG